MCNNIINNIDDKYKFLDVKYEIKRIITNHTDDNGVCELAKIHIYRYFNDNVLPNFNNKHKVDYLKNIEGIKDPNLDKDVILSRRKLDTILDELINEKFISMDDNNTIHLLVEKDFDTDKLIAEYTTDLINQLKLHKLRTSQKVNDENYSQILEEVTNKFLDRIAHLNFNYIDEKTINPVNVMADSVLTSLEDTYAKFIYDETKHDGNFALSKQHTDEAIEDIINIIRKNVKLMNDNIYLAVHLKVDIFKRLEHNFGTISVKQRPWIDMKIDMKISSLIRSLNKQNKEKNQLYYQEIYLKRTKEHTPNFYEKMMREEKLNKLIIKS